MKTPRLTRGYYQILNGRYWTCESRLAESFGDTPAEAYSQWRKTRLVVIGAWAYFIFGVTLIAIAVVAP